MRSFGDGSLVHGICDDVVGDTGEEGSYARQQAHDGSSREGRSAGGIPVLKWRTACFKRIVKSSSGAMMDQLARELKLKRTK